MGLSFFCTPKLVQLIRHSLDQIICGLTVLKHNPEETGPHFEAFVIKKVQRNLFCLVRNIKYPDFIGFEEVPPESFEDSDVYYSTYNAEKYPDIYVVFKALRNLA